MATKIPEHARDRLRNLAAANSEMRTSLTSLIDRANAARARQTEIRMELAPLVEWVARFNWASHPNPASDPRFADYESRKILADELSAQLAGLDLVVERVSREETAARISMDEFATPLRAILKTSGITLASLGAA